MSQERIDGIYADSTVLTWESDDGRREVTIDLCVDGAISVAIYDRDHKVYDSHHDEYVVDCDVLIPAAKAPAFLTALQAWIEQLNAES